MKGWKALLGSSWMCCMLLLNNSIILLLLFSSSSTSMICHAWTTTRTPTTIIPIQGFANQKQRNFYNLNCLSSTIRQHPRKQTTIVKSSNNDKNLQQPATTTDPIVKQTSINLRRISWLSWWSQIILTTISSVIYLFARSVGRSVGMSPWQPSNGNFLLAGSGIFLSFISIFWTWGGGARLSRRIIRLPTSKEQTITMLQRAIRVGVSLNLIGMFLILLGMEQTVGTLAVKVLTVRPWAAGTAGAASAGLESAVWAGIQPLDILVVQANTNSLLSHFCSLVAFLYITRFIEKLKK